MFQITQYLQYQNTTDNKPRVLVEEVDYTNIYNNQLFDTHRLTYTSKPDDDGFKKVEGELKVIANLLDCRPLLSVEIDGKVWMEGDIICKSTMKKQIYGIFCYNKEDVNFMFDFGSYALPVFNLNVEFFRHFEQFNFFEDPAKYSELLWNSTEEEGWERVFELLNIKV
jgi:hypothetical protein